MRRVRTDRGDFEADVVVIACGVWSPRIARMAGASIPLTPAVHQMIDVGPVPRFLDSKTAVDFPIVRDMDTNMYERQDGQRPRGRLVRAPADPPRPRRDPLDRGGGADADRAAVHAGGLRAAARARAPARAGDPRRRVGRDQVRDQRPALADARRPAAARRDARGEGPLVGGGGLGQGRPRSRQVRSPSGWCSASRRSTSSRPTSRASTPSSARQQHVKGRAAGGLQQDVRDRPPGRAVGVEPRRPLSRRSTSGSRELGAVFFEAAAWERPHWYESNAPLVEEYGVQPREARVGRRAGGRRSSTPSTLRCASAPRCST